MAPLDWVGHVDSECALAAADAVAPAEAAALAEAEIVEIAADSKFGTGVFAAGIVVIAAGNVVRADSLALELGGRTFAVLKQHCEVVGVELCVEICTDCTGRVPHEEHNYKLCSGFGDTADQRTLAWTGEVLLEADTVVADGAVENSAVVVVVAVAVAELAVWGVASCIRLQAVCAAVSKLVAKLGDCMDSLDGLPYTFCTWQSQDRWVGLVCR